MLLLMTVSLAGCDDEPITPSNTVSAPTVVLYPDWWPKNEYTEQIPAPPTGVEFSEAFNEENSCSVMMIKATYKMADEYVTKLQKKGFTLDVAPMAYEMMDVYMFSAKNEQGYTVEMIYTAGTLSITVRK